MLEDPVNHVGDRFETAMRVPRGALGFSGRVFHFAHLIHVDERVKQSQIDPGEGAAYRETLTLETTRRGGDREDWSCAHALVWFVDPGKQQDVVYSHGWHEGSSLTKF